VEPDLLWKVAAFLISAGAVYGGIRSDLKGMHRRIDSNERAIEKAHSRIDDCAGCKGGGMMIDSGGAAFIAAGLIRKFEGLRLAPYFCPAGVLTVGYGHVIHAQEVGLRAGVTEAEAEALLMRDMAWALYAARDVGRVLADGQAAALASLVFNIGAQAWATSTIRGAVMAGDMAAAAGQFGRWNKGGGRVLPGLVARRAAEERIFRGESWIG